MMFIWVPQRFRISAWAMGLQAGSKVPGRTLSLSSSPSSSLSMLPDLQQTLAASSPWASRMAASCFVSSRRPMQVAIPIFSQPMSFARAMVSSTLVQRATTASLPGIFW